MITRILMAINFGFVGMNLGHADYFLAGISTAASILGLIDILHEVKK